MGNHSPIPNESQLTLTQELIQRYKKRARECFINPNPYFVKGQLPTEYQDIYEKIKQLEKIKIIS